MVLAALAVAAYSLLLDPATADDVDKLTEDSEGNDTVVIAGAQLEWFSGVPAEKVFVFVILAANEDGPGTQIENAVKQAEQGIANQGVAVATRNLLPSDQGFKDTMTKYGVASLPAVLALKKGGGAKLVEGEINEANLLKAYLSCSPSSSSCCPGGAKKESCNPSACGK
jgi:hypothetical protein